MLKVILAINLVFILIVFIEEYKSLHVCIIWAFVCLILPLLGFAVYVLFGNKLKFKAKNQILNKQHTTKQYLKQTSWYANSKIMKKNNVWLNNKVTFFYNGKSFFNCLIKDIKKAKYSINIMFYILKDDAFGKELQTQLIKKAKEGVAVNVVYDALGSRKTSNKFWQKMKDEGICVAPYFPPIYKLNFLNLKVNYRNHKKIVVIDGAISYTGGINIRADHMGRNKKLTPWRDTQIKLQGTATYELQNLFLNDLAFATKSNILPKQIDKYFKMQQCKEKNKIKIIDSGPLQKSKILNEYLKIISTAKDFLIIQTPYFVVEKNVIQQILNAKNRGVNVMVFIPKKPDKKIVYSATLKTIKPFVLAGVSVFLYNGFIHSKTLLTSSVLSVGSCNFDNRSFYLNFENTCLFYNKAVINQNFRQIKKDMLNSEQLTIKKYKKLVKKYSIFNWIYALIKNIL